MLSYSVSDPAKNHCSLFTCQLKPPPSTPGHCGGRVSGKYRKCPKCDIILSKTPTFPTTFHTIFIILPSTSQI